MRLRYAGTCVRCGTPLPAGEEALYDPSAKKVRCLQCLGPPIAAAQEIQLGTAGASAAREYERRKLAREERVKSRLGNRLGGVLLAATGDPQSTRAWARGAIGEQKLAEALAGLDELMLLHDRRVPGTRGNIDHVVIGPPGVFVVDAKRYQGLIRIRDRGGLFRSDIRLYVGSRDCSRLAENMGWQVRAVQAALASAATDVEVTPVLCFVDGEWPLISPPRSYAGVRLESKRSIRRLVSQPRRLDPDRIQQLTRLIAAALPAK